MLRRTLNSRSLSRITPRSRSRKLSTRHATAIKELESRGLVAQLSSRELLNAADSTLTVYCGVDPSARSLHLGNLLPLVTLLHFHLRGHQVISLIGGATGSIGDPGGRSSERKLLAQGELDFNIGKITKQVHKFYRNAEEYAKKRHSLNQGTLPSPKVLNNIDWFRDVSLLDFLRNVGKHAKVNTMMSRDSVQSRLNSSQGISFTEFSYQLLQAHDFYTLYHDHGCQLQIGGSDQWGNIVSGIELIRRRKNEGQIVLDNGDEMDPSLKKEDEAFGLTIPLLTTPSGEKFGKSAGNAIWLDRELTSVFDFYQYFMRLSDEMVVKLLPMFTLQPLDKISELLEEHKKDPSKRLAHRTLASEVTELVHGEQAVVQAQASTKALYEVSLAELNVQDVIDGLQGDPRLVKAQASDLIGKPLTKLMATYGKGKSRGEIQQILKAGGFYLNNQRMGDHKRALESTDLLGGRMVILRTGAENHLVVVIDQ